MRICLASTSPYRRDQLKNLGLEFYQCAPPFDEDSLKNKIRNARKLCAQLAFEKAKSVVPTAKDDVVIAADQLVSLKGKVLGKPGTRKNAIAQLKSMSGKTHELITCLCMHYKGRYYSSMDVAKITLYPLKERDILNSIYRDNPLDCAGSYKLERSGLTLVKKLSTKDPSSLTGLPVLALIRLLKKIEKRHNVSIIR